MKKHRQPRRVGLSELVRRFWWRSQGEQAVLIVFWPRDYQRGKVYEIDGRFYRITRYFHASDYRFYEVWGREVDCKPPGLAGTYNRAE
jgi:hypothetical protein